LGSIKELGREPKNVRVLTFKDDGEKIATVSPISL